jgi:hypothetical protein
VAVAIVVVLVVVVVVVVIVLALVPVLVVAANRSCQLFLSACCRCQPATRESPFNQNLPLPSSSNIHPSLSLFSFPSSHHHSRPSQEVHHHQAFLGRGTASITFLRCSLAVDAEWGEDESVESGRGKVAFGSENGDGDGDGTTRSPPVARSLSVSLVLGRHLVQYHCCASFFVSFCFLFLSFTFSLSFPFPSISPLFYLFRRISCVLRLSARPSTVVATTRIPTARTRAEVAEDGSSSLQPPQK